MIKDNEKAVKDFYFLAEDASDAFEYRLQRAIKSLEYDTPDYQSLRKAFQYLTFLSKINLIIKYRESLFRIAKTGGFIGDSRLLFLENISDIAKNAGDVDLAAIFTAAYVSEALNSLRLEPTIYSTGLNLLNIYSCDNTVSKSVKAEIALTTSEVMLRYGFAVNAMQQVRLARKFSATLALSAKCHIMAGDINSFFGKYNSARRCFKRALEVTDGIKPFSRSNSEVIYKYLISEIKCGDHVKAIDFARGTSPEPTSEDKNSVVQACFSLEVARLQGDGQVLAVSLKLNNALRKLPRQWRNYCKLSLVIADHLTQSGNSKRSSKYLEDVLRLSAGGMNPSDLVNANLLLAQSHWNDAKLSDVLAALRTAMDLLRDKGYVAQTGLVNLLRAKVAFYNGRLFLALKLALKAQEIFLKAGAAPLSYEAFRIIAISLFWKGKPGNGVSMLEKCLEVQKVKVATDEIVRTSMVLASISPNSDHSKVNDWKKLIREIARRQTKPTVKIMHSLIESEDLCCNEEYSQAEEVVMMAMQNAKILAHMPLLNICNYLLIKIHILSGKYNDADKYLSSKRENSRNWERMMWKPLDKLLKQQSRKYTDFKPVGAFVF